jgi:hypothetical protein
MKRFNLKKSNDVEVKKQYQVKISNRFEALENLDDDDDVDIKRTWESIRENKKPSATKSLTYCMLKHHTLWFDEECSELLDRMKQAKLQWLQNQSQTNGDNLKNVRCEASGILRKKGRI